MFFFAFRMMVMDDQTPGYLMNANVRQRREKEEKKGKVYGGFV
jgi:hypothetical protein